MYRKTWQHITFYERRRARRGDEDSSRSYTYELAALHLELLVAMAAVDEQVQSVEVEAVLCFIDRTSLPQADIERLAAHARDALRSPPDVSLLTERLSKFARRPALARIVMNDLAAVASADARSDPREVKMLAHVGAALNITPSPIKVPSSTRVGEGAPATSSSSSDRQATNVRLATQRRARTAVRTALEASYESRERNL